MAAPETLPDDALVVRGGQCRPENFVRGPGVILDEHGLLLRVSVNAGPNVSIAELTGPNPTLNYAGIPHRRVGVTSVGAVRTAGGEVTAAPSRKNPLHCVLSGLTPVKASELFHPLVDNPNGLKD